MIFKIYPIREKLNKYVYNIFKDEKKINLETKDCNFMDGNDVYILLVSLSMYIFIYAFKSNKPLIRITENDGIKTIRFSFDDYNLFLCSTKKNAIKIYKISNSKYVILKTINLMTNAHIHDCYFIPKSNNNILVANDNLIRIFNQDGSDKKVSISLKTSDISFSFSNDGKIFGYIDGELLTFYKFDDGEMNKVNILEEDFVKFHIRKSNKNEKYNLIMINSKNIKYYNDILENKFEKIILSKRVRHSHFDDYYDFLYLSTDSLTIIQISNWDRILQIQHEFNLIPLHSFRLDPKLMKGFISIENLNVGFLFKYFFHSSKLIEKNECDDSKTDDDDYLEHKITKLSTDDLSFRHNVIENLEIKKKKYLHIKEIKSQLDANFQYSISSKKIMAKKYLANFKREGNLYEQYIELVKIIINDNVDKDILTKYLLFLYENKDNKDFLNYENIDSYDEEIKYYRVCFTQQELINKFNYKKDNDEKTEFLLLLKKISIKQISEENISYIFKDLEEIKENLSTFNQPIEFSNKELYFYMNKVTLALEILKKKEKNKLQSIKNIQTSIKLVLDRKLFDNSDIINNERKFSKLMIIILRGQEEEITEYNLNLIKEIDYTVEKKKDLILNLKDNLFLNPANIIPGIIVDLSNIKIDRIDSKYNFSNFLISLKSNETYRTFQDFERYNDEELLNYFKSKINFNKIKSYMKSILLSNTIKEAFEVLYEEKYKYPFTNENEASEYVEKYIDFIVLKDKTAKGATNKYNLRTNIFLKKCKEFKPEDISDTILYGCLYSGIIIKIFIHELNHEFYNFYFYHSNGSIPLSTPRKDTINEREGGKFFELLLFKTSIKKMYLNQSLYILNRKNFDKPLSEFSKDFLSPNENDLNIEGEFSYLNKEIKKLKNENVQFTNYYLKTDDDEYFDFNDLEMDADVEDDVIGSII